MVDFEKLYRLVKENNEMLKEILPTSERCKTRNIFQTTMQEKSLLT